MSQLPPVNEKEAFICIDIGSASIKIAEAVKTELGVKFNAVAVESVLERKNLTDAETAGIIKNLMESSGISSTRAVFALSGTQVIIRHVDFPKMPAEALDKNVKNEMKKELSQAAENYDYHHLVLKEFEAKNEDGTTQKKMKVLVCAAERSAVSKIKEIAKLAGFTIHSITSANVGLYSLAKKMGTLDMLSQDEVLMYLDFGNSQITTNFISRDGLRFSKDINMGGSTLTTVIKTLNPGGSPITMTEAEEIKFNIGILSQDAVDGMDDANPNANLHKVLNVSFRKLLQRIRLSTGYFFAHFKESVSFQALKTIYLGGGNSEIKGVKDFFGEYYGSSIVKINCWDVAGSEDCDPEIKSKYNVSFVNICAAMHEFFYPEYFINLGEAKKTSAEIKASEAFSFDNVINKNFPALKSLLKHGTLNTVTFFLAAYAVLFSSLFAWNYWSLNSLEAEKKYYESETLSFKESDFYKNREQLDQNYAVYLKKKNSIDSIKFKKYSMDNLLLIVLKCIPDDVSLRTVSFINADKPLLTMSGTTSNYDSAAIFSDSLKKNKLFSGLRVIENAQRDSRVEFKFELDLSREVQK